MRIIRMLFRILWHLVVGILRSPIDFIIMLCRYLRSLCDLRRYRKRLPCLPLPPDILRKPDPLIYCQSARAGNAGSVVLPKMGCRGAMEPSVTRERGSAGAWRCR